MSRKKKQRKKLLAAVFGGLCALLVLDRLFFGGTSAVDEAQASEATVVAPQTAARREPAGDVPPTEVHPALMTERFEAFRAGNACELEELPDLFAPAAWARTPVSSDPGAIVDQGRMTGSEFEARHRLHAVISGGAKAGVILDGVFVGVGEEVDGYILRGTTARSAVFVRDETEVKLVLADPGR